MAAWRGGHRPGASQQQWAFARVNSFITKGSGTWGKADSDLAAKARASMKKKNESINETGGAGEFGTKALLARYQKDTPYNNYNQLTILMMILVVSLKRNSKTYEKRTDLILSKKKIWKKN